MKTLLDDKMFQILHIMRDWSSDTLQELTESELYTLDSCFIDLGYDIAYLCTDKKLFSEVQNGLYELAEEISNHPIREYIQEKMQTGQQDFANSNPNQAFISFQEIIDSVEPEIEERIQ